MRTDVSRMAAVASAVEFVGEEELRGMLTRHYRVVLDLAPARQPNPARP
ncbi:hypothetical protein ACJ5H2_11990 [Nocardioides sp. R1-1]